MCGWKWMWYNYTIQLNPNVLSPCFSYLLIIRTRNHYPSVRQTRGHTSVAEGKCSYYHSHWKKRKFSTIIIIIKRCFRVCFSRQRLKFSCWISEYLKSITLVGKMWWMILNNNNNNNNNNNFLIIKKTPLFHNILSNYFTIAYQKTIDVKEVPKYNI